MNYQEFADKNDIKIEHPKQGRIPLKLYKHQLELLDAFDKNDRTIVNKARQLGTSITMCFYAYVYCLLNPHSTIVIVPIKANGREWLKNDIRNFVSFPEFEAVNNSEICFNNGSRIMFDTFPDQFRGSDIDIFMFDEYAFNINDKKFFDYVQEVPHKKEIYVSTPNGMKNVFYNLWRYGSKNDKIKLDCYGIVDKTRIEELKRMCGINSFRQEYECWFNPEDTQDKTEVMNIRLTETEKSDMEYIAKVKGFRSLSDYIRFLANRDKRNEE